MIIDHDLTTSIPLYDHDYHDHSNLESPVVMIFHSYHFVTDDQIMPIPQGPSVCAQCTYPIVHATDCDILHNWVSLLAPGDHQGYAILYNGAS